MSLKNELKKVGKSLGKASRDVYETYKSVAKSTKEGFEARKLENQKKNHAEAVDEAYAQKVKAHLEQQQLEASVEQEAHTKFCSDYPQADECQHGTAEPTCTDCYYT